VLRVTLWRASTGLAAAALLLASAGGNAAPQPMTLARFTDPAAEGSRAGQPSCAIEVVALEDRRSDPEIIGVYNRKAVKAPADREAWLREIVRALSNRGVTARFSAAAAGDSSAIRTQIYLERAWVTNTLNDIAANVVFRVNEPDGPPEGTLFRGIQQKTTYFSGGEGKIQRGMDSAFGEALDGIAAHFRARCAAAAAPPA
jgi:hypothetical protein